MMTFLHELLSRRRINRLTEIQRRLDELDGSVDDVIYFRWAMTPDEIDRVTLWRKQSAARERNRLAKEQHRLRRKMI